MEKWVEENPVGWPNSKCEKWWVRTFLQRHSHGSFASVQPSATLPQPWVKCVCYFLVIGLCPQQAHRPILLCLRSLRACLLVIPLSNVSQIIMFKINCLPPVKYSSSTHLDIYGSFKLKSAVKDFFFFFFNQSAIWELHLFHFLFHSWN